MKGIREEAISAMLNYPWPGNVRELKNTIERIMIIDNPELILLKHLPREISDGTCSNAAAGPLDFELPDTGLDIKEFIFSLQGKLIGQALAKTNNNKTAAAKLLNLDRFSLRYLMNKCRIT